MTITKTKENDFGDKSYKMRIIIITVMMTIMTMNTDHLNSDHHIKMIHTAMINKGMEMNLPLEKEQHTTTDKHLTMMHKHLEQNLRTGQIQGLDMTMQMGLIS